MRTIVIAVKCSQSVENSQSAAASWLRSEIGLPFRNPESRAADDNPADFEFVGGSGGNERKDSAIKSSRAAASNAMNPLHAAAFAFVLRGPRVLSSVNGRANAVEHRDDKQRALLITQ